MRDPRGAAAKLMSGASTCCSTASGVRRGCDSRTTSGPPIRPPRSRSNVATIARQSFWTRPSRQRRARPRGLPQCDLRGPGGLVESAGHWHVPYLAWGAVLSNRCTKVTNQKWFVTFVFVWAASEPRLQRVRVELRLFPATAEALYQRAAEWNVSVSEAGNRLIDAWPVQDSGLHREVLKEKDFRGGTVGANRPHPPTRQVRERRQTRNRQQ